MPKIFAHLASPYTVIKDGIKTHLESSTFSIDNHQLFSPEDHLTFFSSLLTKTRISSARNDGYSLHIKEVARIGPRILASARLCDRHYPVSKLRRRGIPGIVDTQHAYCGLSTKFFT